jgi:four helix bundle protein
MIYLSLDNLDVYKLARDYSRKAWEIYEKLDWQQRKVIGDQAITSIDSVGANIAEGYGRFHYLDKNKFYYNARGSLLESKHWLELLKERKLVSEEKYAEMLELYKNLLLKLNILIKSQYKQKIS